MRGYSEGVGGSGVAVDNESGDVYVADTGNHRIDEFDPAKPASERFVRAWGLHVGPLGEDECTTLSGCKAATSGSEPGALEAPAFIAVDNSATSASKGDVYVGDTGDDLVSKFTPEGVLVASWGNNGTPGAANGQLNGAPGEPFGALAGIVVNPAGELYVSNTPGQVFVFGQEGVFEKSFGIPFGHRAGRLHPRVRRECLQNKL